MTDRTVMFDGGPLDGRERGLARKGDLPLRVYMNIADGPFVYVYERRKFSPADAPVVYRFNQKATVDAMAEAGYVADDILAMTANVDILAMTANVDIPAKPPGDLFTVEVWPTECRLVRVSDGEVVATCDRGDINGPEDAKAWVESQTGALSS
ncbi:MAG: hypothetical protein M3Q98_00995 [Actinomycetota bacterium]|nr:hypothetical protein [Actinomycetota bacterium]